MDAYGWTRIKLRMFRPLPLNCFPAFSITGVHEEPYHGGNPFVRLKYFKNFGTNAPQGKTRLPFS
jgi:hypothetical protein